MKNYVYVVMRDCQGTTKLTGVCATEENATRCVNTLARCVYGLERSVDATVSKPWKYGWPTMVWWERTLVCD